MMSRVRPRCSIGWNWGRRQSWSCTSAEPMAIGATARDRWARTFEKKLSRRARNRLVLENDDISFSATDVLKIHRLCGVRLVFDYQHFWCLNPGAPRAAPDRRRLPPHLA